ncbi:MAG: AAA family ATPase, partial [Acidimicrobiia bacterium]
YQARVLKNFLMLAESQLTIGEYEEAIASASAALRVQPYAEEAFRIQMLSHYAMGHEHCARQVFDTCRNRLVADCTSVTEDLAAAIDAGEPLSLLIWSNSGRRPIVTTATGPATDRQRERRDPKLVMPFLGRVAELECLTAIVERSMQHQLTFSLVTGRYGIGKTTILERLRERFWNVSGIVSLSPTGATSRRLPLADALVGALEGRGASGAATRYCSGPYLRGDHDAFVTLSSIIRDNGPLVFLLDDLDLADTATIEALAWLRRHEPNLPLAVVMSSYPTSRFTDFGVHLSFDTMLALQPLEASDVEVLGPEGEPVRHRCGGHPLLMTDLWRWRATGADGDPPSLHELVKGQTRELGASTIAVLEAMASIAEPVPISALARVLNAPVRDIERSVLTLSRAGLARMDVDGIRTTQPVLRHVINETVAARGRGNATTRQDTVLTGGTR